MRFLHSRLLRFAPLVALAMGGVSAHAQNVISRQVTEEPVETTVTQTPGGTVITRRPLAGGPVAPDMGGIAVERAVVPARDYGAVPLRRFETNPSAPRARATFVDETVGAAPAERTVTTRRVTSAPRANTTRVIRSSNASATEGPRRVTRSVQRTITPRRVAAAPLMLDPTQRRIVYRTIVQEQVVPGAPFYPGRPAVGPSTTGYGYGIPPDVDYLDNADDVYVEQEAVPTIYPARYVVGSQLPAGIVLAPVPAATALQVPAIRPYAYARVGGRLLLVDPVTYTVVADITP
ncbi:MAG TPA: DUF1236 domain-containing protein [Xanthobacteraceae bacterium]|jgi:hypothetical protein|nr:DUF1236 domain-containing protein [Xanthobacteraceae bacterium]